jgi:NAD-dependent SIR2 family protein deacetylase
MQTKFCTKCGTEKDIEQFFLRADRPGKRRSQCVECRKKYITPYNKMYVEKNKETLYKKTEHTKRKIKTQ